MCTRVAVKTPGVQLAAQFAARLEGDLESGYNLGPNRGLPVLRQESGARLLRSMRWGLVPAWRKDPGGTPLVNARSETMAEKASFRDAFRSSRCLLLIDGFYEWKSLGGGKQPYFVRRVDEAPMALAGLYSVFGREQVLWTCAAVTLAARGGMLALHERMPAVLDAEGQQRWLDEASAFDAASLFALLERGDGAGGMDVERVPVSSWVNDVRHEGPRCIQPVEIARQQLLFD